MSILKAVGQANKAGGRAGGQAGAAGQCHVTRPLAILPLRNSAGGWRVLLLTMAVRHTRMVKTPDAERSGGQHTAVVRGQHAYSAMLLKLLDCLV